MNRNQFSYGSSTRQLVVSIDENVAFRQLNTTYTVFAAYLYQLDAQYHI